MMHRNYEAPFFIEMETSMMHRNYEAPFFIEMETSMMQLCIEIL
jgi:hypothetical protein